MDEISRMIKIVSNKSDKYGDKLIAMMDYYDVGSLSALTLSEIKEFIHICGWSDELKKD